MISRVKKITNLHYKNWEIDVEVSLPGKVNALIGRVTGFLHCFLVLLHNQLTIPCKVIQCA